MTEIDRQKKENNTQMIIFLLLKFDLKNKKVTAKEILFYLQNLKNLYLTHQAIYYHLNCLILKKEIKMIIEQKKEINQNRPICYFFVPTFAKEKKLKN